MAQFAPDRILIEPSGVGKLSDVIRAVQNLGIEGVELNSFTTVADANKCRMYAKNFGEFYNDQIGHANSIILSRTEGISEQKLDACVELLKQQNQIATIITTPWNQLSGAQILEAMEHKSTLTEELKALADETARLNEIAAEELLEKGKLTEHKDDGQGPKDDGPKDGDPALIPPVARPIPVEVPVPEAEEKEEEVPAPTVKATEPKFNVTHFDD